MLVVLCCEQRAEAELPKVQSTEFFLVCLSVCVKFLCSHEQSSGKGTINKSMFSSSLALVYAGSLGVSYNLGHPNKTWDVYQHNFFSISG